MSDITITLSVEDWSRIQTLIHEAIHDDSDGCCAPYVDEAHPSDKIIMNSVRNFWEQFD